jgi:phage FluMu protein Com
MPPLPAQGQEFEVTCPHCKKPFTANLMAGAAARHHGFKCPHCKLFVPYQRAEERDLLDPTV